MSLSSPMKRAIATLSVLFVALWLGAARADALTEFCPASVENIESSGLKGSPSTEYSYDLNADIVRTIADASIIADTDHGWYRWSLSNVPLAAATTTEVTPKKTYTRDYAKSDRLFVAFPDALLVRHAWITTARTTGDGVACLVPAYKDRGVDTAELERAQARKATPPPKPVGHAATPFPAGVAQAVPTSIPFDNIDCDVPFRQATVTAAQVPDYPTSERGGTSVSTTLVAVAVDEKGNSIDPWVYATSGSAAFDRSALRAARMSSYSAPISYCQKVRGVYLFTATFLPRP
jgi:outer membrane biosynthesis protein TonB